MKYRTKNAGIEAFQMTEERGSDNVDWPEWLNRAWQFEENETGALYILSHLPRTLAIRTPEGPMVVSWGDYIVHFGGAELYPCKPDIFEASYEEVT